MLTYIGNKLTKVNGNILSLSFRGLLFDSRCISLYVTMNMGVAAVFTTHDAAWSSFGDISMFVIR